MPKESPKQRAKRLDLYQSYTESGRTLTCIRSDAYPQGKTLRYDCLKKGGIATPLLGNMYFESTY